MSDRGLRDAWNRLQEIVQNEYVGCTNLAAAMNDVAGAIAAEIICRDSIALTARSEGFREGVETAAKVCEKRAQALSEDPNNGYVEGDTNAFIWTNLEAGYVAEELDEAAETIRVLSPRETDAGPQEPSGKSPGPAGNSGHKQNSPRGEPVRDVPVASAPSGEVAEVVKHLHEFATYEEQDSFAHRLLLNAAALLAQLPPPPERP